MKLTNPGDRFPIVANIDGRVYEVPVDEPVEVEDYVVAATLVEYGAVANQDELNAARALWAAQNRGINSSAASASASEGAILGRRQATVDVQSGTVTGNPEPLAGASLKAAVKAAKEAGAEIKSGLSAAEQRAALEAWQASRGSSTPIDHDQEFVTDEAGELVLGDDGQPFRISEVEHDDEGEVKLGDDGLPVVKSLEPSSSEGDGSDPEIDVKPGTGGDPSAGTGGDGAGPDQGPTDPADPGTPA